MKRIILTLCVMLCSQAAFSRGVDSSGGGSGGALTLSTGYSPGGFSVTAFSAKEGALATVFKYFLLVGAKEQTDSAGTSYVVESESAFLINSSFQEPESPHYYQLNITLPFTDVYEVSAGPRMSSLSFRGPLAEVLYQAMDQAGAEVVGRTLAPNTHEVVGKIMVDGSLLCQMGPEGGLRGGTWCELRTRFVD